MKSQKNPTASSATCSRLAHDLIVQTEMCQSAIKDLKKLMKKSNIQQNRKKLPSSTNKNMDSKAQHSVSQNKSSQQVSTFKMQNGHQYSVDIDTTEAKGLFERLSQIGEEVDDFLRISEDSLKCLKRLRRESSVLNKKQDDVFCDEEERVKQISKMHDGSLSSNIIVGDCEGDKNQQKFSALFTKNAFSDCDKDSMFEATEICREDDEDLVQQMLEVVDDDHEEYESEDDGLKEQWHEAEFCRNLLIQEERASKKDLSADKQECRHAFFLKSDVGLVCDLCGLVGNDIEAIFTFTWKDEFRPQESKQGEGKVAQAGEVPAVAESMNVNVDTVEQQGLIIHSSYRAEMHEHQIKGFKFLEENIVQGGRSGCILAHSPGTGKTFLTIAFLHSFLQAYPNERIMILAPKGMLLPWVREFQKWKVNVRLLNLYESSSSLLCLATEHNDRGIAASSINAATQLKLNQLQRVKEWQMTKSILLVSYQHFSSLVNHQTGDAVTMEVKRKLLEIPGLLILDEGHISRNSDTVILKCLSSIHTTKRILLSGTLFQNNFEEMYTLFKLVRPNFMREQSERLKGFMKALFEGQGERMHAKFFDVKSNAKKSPEKIAEQRIFVNGLCETIETGTAEEQLEAITLLHELMEPFVNWHKGKVLEGLPGLTDFTIFLKLTATQEAAFAAIRNQDLNAMDRERRSALANVHPMLLSMKSRQPTQDSDFNNERSEQNVDSIDASSCCRMSDWDQTQGCKLMFVLYIVALCSELKEKVLIFSQNLASLTLLQKLFWKLNGWVDKKQVLRLDGELPSESREHIIDRFNNGKHSRVFLASIKACGEGVSLVGASRVIFLDLTWNPAVIQQAISRAFRLGQTKKVYAYRLVGIGTLDEDIERAASKKEWLAAKISHSDTNVKIESGGEADLMVKDRLFESTELSRHVAKWYCKTQDRICP